ncbi:MAG: leucine-rich repeat domain-containing protein [Treponema sp.]|jgi:hypothetical protein|nr:leucine-rich repeat domain-containing protein [Treponema sp.]
MKNGKNVFVLLIMVLAGLQLSCGGSAVSKLEKAIKESIQNTMDSESPFNDYEIKIDSVKLVKSGDYTFNGTVNVTVGKIKDTVNITEKLNVLKDRRTEFNVDVISEGQNVVWYIDPSAFAFLGNAPEDIVRVGLSTETARGVINVSSEPNEGKDFKYDLNAAKDKAVILEYVGERSSVVIPVSLDGFPVMEIAEGAFKGNEHITSVVLPPVKAILNNTFRDCKNLVTVTLPDTLVFIGDNVFENCQSLVSITIPNSVHFIGRGAFYNCLSLYSVTLPNAIESIERSTFMNCSLLASIKIPESVRYIVFQGFRNCSNLLEVEMPSHQITYIGGNSSIDEDRYRVIFDKDENRTIRQARPVNSTNAGKGAWDGAFEEISFLDLNRTTQITGWDALRNWRPITFQRYRILPNPDNFAFDGCLKLDIHMRLKIEQSGYKGTFY